MILVDYFTDQPYVDLSSGFPKVKANASVIKVFNEFLDKIFEQALEDEDMERELDTYHEALERCRIFLRRFVPRSQQTFIGGAAHDA
jgi:hypothetical protein